MASKKKSKGGSRRRVAKPTSAETVETKTGPSAQYKLPEPGKLEHHLANAEAWEAKGDDIKARIKKVYEAAAADGVSKKLIKEVMSLKSGDPIAARQWLESVGVGLKVIGHPFQLTIFDTMYENPVDQARAEGRLAGRTSKSPECRFPEGSPAADAYLEEYRLEQAKLVPGADKLSDGEIRGALEGDGKVVPIGRKEIDCKSPANLPH